MYMPRHAGSDGITTTGLCENVEGPRQTPVCVMSRVFHASDIHNAEDKDEKRNTDWTIPDYTTKTYTQKMHEQIRNKRSGW